MLSPMFRALVADGTTTALASSRQRARESEQDETKHGLPTCEVNHGTRSDPDRGDLPRWRWRQGWLVTTRRERSAGEINRTEPEPDEGGDSSGSSSDPDRDHVRRRRRRQGRLVSRTPQQRPRERANPRGPSRSKRMDGPPKAPPWWPICVPGKGRSGAGSPHGGAAYRRGGVAVARCSTSPCTPSFLSPPSSRA